jgi:K+ transporter
MGLFGADLLYGDGIITPAKSHGIQVNGINGVYAVALIIFGFGQCGTWTIR